MLKKWDNASELGNNDNDVINHWKGLFRTLSGRRLRRQGECGSGIGGNYENTDRDDDINSGNDIMGICGSDADRLRGRGNI